MHFPFAGDIFMFFKNRIPIDNMTYKYNNTGSFPTSEI